MTRAITRTIQSEGRVQLFRRRVALEIIGGPKDPRGFTRLVTAEPIVTIGSSEHNQLVVSDPAVSRHHVRVELKADALVVSDLGSTNGTWLGDLRVHRVEINKRVELRLGATVVAIEPEPDEEEIPISDRASFGQLLGRSVSMRELFQRLRSVAGKDVTVLIEGETGTGKELIARELHQHSKRKDGPFVVVDLGAIPETLIEAELFGHVRGAYTGANEDRPGAFEEANGGTIFLDEIGELLPSMQPKLLRALERQEVKRLGSSKHVRFDARVVAATHRDLMRGMNEGSFRSDLYYRLAVIHLRVPPLRDRPDDVELLLNHMLQEAAARLDAPVPTLDPATRQQIIGHPWPGNARELRNFVERLVALSSAEPALELPTSSRASAGGVQIEDVELLPFKEAKAQWTQRFDEAYLSRLLARTAFNVAEAARQSGIDRVHLFRLIKKLGLKRPDSR
ncbi:MAG: sigma 54-interacting transcriptional regulator [Deltaproteobacteria bacterium]|nr:sigma 54-interacting transcriptional regulator [Deltaproteobacteria bacterium]